MVKGVNEAVVAGSAPAAKNIDSRKKTDMAFIGRGPRPSEEALAKAREIVKRLATPPLPLIGDVDNVSIMAGVKMSAHKMIRMTWDQVDNIVVEELQSAYNNNLRLDTDEGGTYRGPDWQLLSALETVLAYFMPKSEYDVWARNAAMQKLTVMTELMGGYDVDKSEPQSAG